MIDLNSQFFAILTKVGEAKQANADALGIPWLLTQMGVGDANGTDPIPDRLQTKLINERRRAPLNQLKIDPANAAVLIAEQIIPADVGGWWVREIGLYDADGDLVAVANCAPSFKPVLTQGSGRTQIVRMNFIVSSTTNVTLKVDPAVVLASREYVDQRIIEELNKQDFKHSALVATTAPIALNGTQTIDGVAVASGDRVLVKDQAQAKANGIYVAANGSWTRAQDADANNEVTPGLFVHIEKGTANGDSVWQLVTDAPIVLGTTDLMFEMAVGKTGVSAGSYRSVTVDKYGRVIAGTNPSTLAGYGITDAYSKGEVDSKVAQASSLPLGSIVAFPKGTVPPGFLELDGSVQSTATYPDLAAYLGTSFNKGDEGAGNFRLPESRGEFLRGWDHGRGVDAGRALGAWQSDDLKTHSHGLNMVLSKASSSVTNGSDMPILSASANVTTNAAGGVETRPRNLAVMWCIKAWNAPINQGSIDIAALAALAVQATEINRGTAKVATQAQLGAGSDDTAFVTSKKLRFGFQYLLAVNGYVVFPSWLMGLTFQWGSLSVAQDTVATVTLPNTFANANLWAGVTGSINRITGGTTQSGTNVTANTLSSIAIANDDAAQTIRWFAFGY